MRTNDKLALQSFALGIVFTIVLYWVMGEYIGFSLPWWGYLLFWLFVSGTLLQEFRQDTVNEKTLDKLDD